MVTALGSTLEPVMIIPIGRGSTLWPVIVKVNEVRGGPHGVFFSPSFRRDREVVRVKRGRKWGL